MAASLNIEISLSIQFDHSPLRIQAMFGGGGGGGPRAPGGLALSRREDPDPRYGDLRRPRRVTFYSNGNRFFPGKRLYITPHRCVEGRGGESGGHRVSGAGDGGIRARDWGVRAWAAGVRGWGWGCQGLDWGCQGPGWGCQGPGWGCQGPEWGCQGLGMVVSQVPMGVLRAGAGGVGGGRGRSGRGGCERGTAGQA